MARRFFFDWRVGKGTEKWWGGSAAVGVVRARRFPVPGIGAGGDCADACMGRVGCAGAACGRCWAVVRRVARRARPRVGGDTPGCWAEGCPAAAPVVTPVRLETLKGEAGVQTPPFY